MVNGEITKVEYGGELYVKVDGKSRAGDLGLRIKDNMSFAKVGEFYPITEGNRFLDDEGDEPYLAVSKFAFFRKEVEPAEEGVLFNGIEYKRVHREAKVGDVVVFTENTSICFTNGEMYGPVTIHETDLNLRVRGDDDIFYCVYFDVFHRTIDNVKVYEPVAKEQPLKVGDYVIFTSDLYEHEKGKIAVIRQIDSRPNELSHGLNDLNGERSGWANPTVFRKATDEEVAAAKAEAEFAKFKEGDKVRLVSGGGNVPLYGFTNGEIYEVTNANYKHYGEGKIQLDNSGYALPHQIEKLSAEEVEKIEAQAELEAKWAEIERKPNEYKEGDIVRVVSSPGALPVGSIFEVKAVDSDGDVYCHEGYIYIPEKRLKLITPVEARFDLAGRMDDRQ
jgi:transcription antitermination factor NusG